MKKIIRILTGRQCGATLDLSPGRVKIGRDIEADIQLLDWQGDSLIIECYEDGRVTLELADEARARRFPEVLGDWVPVRRYDTVLCVGPADLTWPCDADLLDRLHSASAIAATKRQRNGAWHGRQLALKVGTAVCAVLVSAGIVVATINTQHSDAAIVRHPAPQARLADVRAVLDRLGQRDLVVSQRDGRVVVSGMLATPRDALAARTALAALQGTPVDSRFAVADAIADDLSAAAGDPSVQVRYVGRGEFSVTGHVPEPARIKTRLSDAATDYGDGMVTLQFHLSRQEVARDVASVIDTRDLRYVQLPDGTKEFTTVQPRSEGE
ncbi:HrpD5 family protein [Paraburkholderia humisilvae]|uniref:Uncharacterized protein n=1 Tax=Paraburkholderia humisilvae TaxID=627669 RepID=A0A6J5F8V7_9BURK|nr:HrpD5 family protein [Paraburkholderia humisilvae]CAB3773606.1 hypothetical protein LMG29542_07341 [Paraburkholderia humisilvae]